MQWSKLSLNLNFKKNDSSSSRSVVFFGKEFKQIDYSVNISYMVALNFSLFGFFFLNLTREIRHVTFLYLISLITRYIDKQTKIIFFIFSKSPWQIFHINTIQTCGIFRKPSILKKRNFLGMKQLSSSSNPKPFRNTIFWKIIKRSFIVIRIQVCS